MSQHSLYFLAPDMDSYNPQVINHLKHGNYQAVAEMIRSAIFSGNKSYLPLLGWMYYRGKGVTQNIQKARDCFKQSAETGDAEGYYYLGLLEHFANNQAIALEYYTRSVELGGASAFYELGLLYIQGVGIMRNPAKAYQYFLEAEKNDNIFALKARAYFLINDYFEKGFLSVVNGYMLLLKWAITLPYKALKDPFRYDGL